MHLGKLFLRLAAIFTSANAQLLVHDNATGYTPASTLANGTRYTILDNDWGSTGFIPFLMAIGANMKVLGIASDTANTWVGQTTLHAVCGHVFAGEDDWDCGVANLLFSSRSWRLVICPAFPWSRARQTPSYRPTSASSCGSNCGDDSSGKVSFYPRISPLRLQVLTPQGVIHLKSPDPP